MRILFICTGNTCRSPMAEVLFNAAAKGRHHASSAGIAAFTGLPAGENALLAMEKRGIDLSSHRSSPLSSALLDRADRVYCMTPSHAAAVAAAFPECKTPVYILEPPVPDPYGGGLEDYERAAEALSAAVKTILSELK